MSVYGGVLLLSWGPGMAACATRSDSTLMSYESRLGTVSPCPLLTVQKDGGGRGRERFWRCRLETRVAGLGLQAMGLAGYEAI